MLAMGMLFSWTIVLVIVAINLLTDLTWRRSIVALAVLGLFSSVVFTPYLAFLERAGLWSVTGSHIFIVLPSVIALAFASRQIVARFRDLGRDKLNWPDTIGQPAYEDACISYLKRHGWQCSKKGGICGMAWIRCTKDGDRGVIVLVRIEQIMTPVLKALRELRAIRGFTVKLVCFRNPTESARTMAAEHNISLMHYAELADLAFTKPAKPLA